MSGALRISGSFDSTAERLKVRTHRTTAMMAIRKPSAKPVQPVRIRSPGPLAARGPRQQRCDDRDDRPDRDERPGRVTHEGRLVRQLDLPRFEEPGDGGVDVPSRGDGVHRRVLRSVSRGPLGHGSRIVSERIRGVGGTMGSEARPRQVETVVVGAGEAGLVMSSFLSGAGTRARPPRAARDARWRLAGSLGRIPARLPELGHVPAGNSLRGSGPRRVHAARQRGGARSSVRRA